MLGGTLIIVETPMQLLSVLCYLDMHALDDEGELDLIVRDCFTSAKKIAAMARSDRRFGRVICVPYEKHSERFGATKFLLKSWVFSAAHRKRFQTLFAELGEKTYARLVCATVTPFTLDIKRFFVPDGTTVFLDEGTGSHNGLLFHNVLALDDILDGQVAVNSRTRLKRLEKRVLRIAFGEQYLYNIAELWLFNPTEDERSLYRNVRIQELTLPSLHDEMLSRLVNWDCIECYVNTRIIFLEQPFLRRQKAYSDQRLIIQTLQKSFGTMFGLKLHPLSEAANDYVGINVLPDIISWEMLVAAGGISDDTILVSFCSSAQSTPKQIANIEPYVVYIYRAMGVSEENEFDHTRRQLSKLYSERERIYAPARVEAVVGLIQKILNGGE